MTAVCAALESSCIVRLKQTWQGISEKYLSRFQTYKKLMSPTSNYSRYRALVSKLRSSKGACIPYLGVYMRDLTFIHEGNATMTNNLINCSKIQLFGTLLRELTQFQKVAINIPTVDPLSPRHVPLDLPQGSNEHDEFYQLSVRLEPRATTQKSPIREPPSSPRTVQVSVSLNNLAFSCPPLRDPTRMTKAELEETVNMLQQQNTELLAKLHQLNPLPSSW